MSIRKFKKRFVAIGLSLVLAAGITGMPFANAKVDLHTMNNDNIASNKVVHIIFDFDGGTYLDYTTLTLSDYNLNSQELIVPEKNGYKFEGWKVVTGDCSIDFSDSRYLLTFGNENGLVKALWSIDSTTPTSYIPVPPSISTSPNITATPNITSIPDITSAPKNSVSLQIDINGGTYNSSNQFTKDVLEGTTIVLFDSVKHITREGYAFDSIDAIYGKCKILNNGQVLYTAPSCDIACIDAVKITWLKADLYNNNTTLQLYP